MNPLAIALASDASFVVRGYAGDMHHLTDLLVEAISFKGFALVDVLQPCVAWNRNQTYEFYGKKVYKLEETEHDTGDLVMALEKAREWGEKIPIGVLYRKERPVYGENFPFLKGAPMARRSLDDIGISGLLREFS